MNYNLESIPTYKLDNYKIDQICKLKDTKWKFGLKSQKMWFKKNIKNKDIHNSLYLGTKIIGYTLLRIRTCKKKDKKITKYILFDTLIVDNKYRNKKISNLIMLFNNLIIKEKRYFAFLTCQNTLVDFYKKKGWRRINKKKFELVDHKFQSNGMTYNFNEKQKLFLYTNI